MMRGFLLLQIFLIAVTVCLTTAHQHTQHGKAKQLEGHGGANTNSNYGDDKPHHKRHGHKKDVTESTTLPNQQTSAANHPPSENLPKTTVADSSKSEQKHNGNNQSGNKLNNTTTSKTAIQPTESPLKQKQNSDSIANIAGTKIEHEIKKLTKEEKKTEVEEIKTKSAMKEEKLKTKEKKIEGKIEQLEDVVNNTTVTALPRAKSKPVPKSPALPTQSPMNRLPHTAVDEVHVPIVKSGNDPADPNNLKQKHNSTVATKSSRQSETTHNQHPNHTDVMAKGLHHHHEPVQKHISSEPVHKFNRRLIPDEQLDALNELLFPNTTGTAKHKLMRRLGIEKAAYNGSVPCVICRDLTTCSILNGYQIEEVYYPKNLNYLETCKVIESFGKRIEKLVFGNGKTFRDTSQCRAMVMQYLCLFYGSDNDMYKNYCIYQEDVKDPNPANHKVAPRPPCKSFCVQIASVCANDPDFFIQTCNNIKCPPTQDECTPDPTLKNKVLAANLGCTVPYYNSPYFRSAAKEGYQIEMVLLLLIPWTIYSLFFPN